MKRRKTRIIEDESAMDLEDEGWGVGVVFFTEKRELLQAITEGYTAL
jgi:hypothetical protein